MMKENDSKAKECPWSLRKPIAEPILELNLLFLCLRLSPQDRFSPEQNTKKQKKEKGLLLRNNVNILHGDAPRILVH